MAQIENGTGVNAQEQAAVFTIAAPFCNKVILNMNGTAVRISFLENFSETETHARAAAVVPLEVAVALRDLLNGMEATALAAGLITPGEG